MTLMTLMMQCVLRTRSDDKNPNISSQRTGYTTSLVDTSIEQEHKPESSRLKRIDLFGEVIRAGPVDLPFYRSGQSPKWTKMPTLTKILLCQRGGNYQLEQDGAYISYDSRTGSRHRYHEYFLSISRSYCTMY